MNFGISVLTVLGIWALLSIVVSVTVGRVAASRDDRAVRAFLPPRALADREDDRERVAS